jgi:hypothetical protein
MFPQSAVDRTGARVGLGFAFVRVLCAYANTCAVLFPTMIDPLDTAATYLHSGRLDEAETICGTVLKAKPGDSWALCLMARAANSRKAYARALDYLARVENPELAHLYVETAIKPTTAIQVYCRQVHIGRVAAIRNRRRPGTFLQGLVGTNATRATRFSFDAIYIQRFLHSIVRAYRCQLHKPRGSRRWRELL